MNVDTELLVQLLTPFASMTMRDDAKPDDYAFEDQKVRVKDVKAVRGFLSVLSIEKMLGNRGPDFDDKTVFGPQGSFGGFGDE